MNKKLLDELVGSVKEAGKIKRGQKRPSRTTEMKAPDVRKKAGSKRSTSKISKAPTRSRTDWTRVRSMRDEDIDTSDIPELTAKAAAGGVVRIGGKVVPRGKSKESPPYEAKRRR